MSSRMVKALAGSLAVAVSVVFGFVMGVRQGQLQCALEEAKVARAALARDDISVEPQLREFLKGRIYYLIGTKLRDSGYVSAGWDVGTVDMNILDKPFYAKDPTFAPRTYADAMAR